MRRWKEFKGIKNSKFQNFEKIKKFKGINPALTEFLVGGKEVRDTWVRISLTSCVTFSKLISLSPKL